MIYAYEERKGANANGRREFEAQEIPAEMQELLKK